MKKEQELIMEYKNFCLNYEPGTCIKSSFGDLIIDKDYCFLTNKNKVNYILDFSFPFSNYTDTDKYPHEFDLNGLKLFLYMLKTAEVDNECIMYNLKEICKLNVWEWEDEITVINLVSIMKQLLYYQTEIDCTSNISIKNNDEDKRLAFLAEVKKDRCFFKIKYGEDESKDIIGSAGIIAFKSPNNYHDARKKINTLVSNIVKIL